MSEIKEKAKKATQKIKVTKTSSFSDTQKLLLKDDRKEGGILTKDLISRIKSLCKVSEIKDVEKVREIGTKDKVSIYAFHHSDGNLKIIFTAPSANTFELLYILKI